MKIVFTLIAVIALIALPFGCYALFHAPAIGGPILISAAVYLGLHSIACRIDEKGPKN